MKKKITSFLTMLVMLFVSVGASAQAVDASEFENKSVSIGAAVNAIETNTWYVIFNGTRANEMGAFVKVGEMPGTGGVLYDNDGSTGLKKNVADIVEGNPASQYLRYFVRLIDASGDGEQNVYQVQFATGKYLAGDLKTLENKYDSGKFNIYPIANNEEGLFGFNKYNMAELVNNNGVNGTLAYWKSGELTSTDYEELKTADTYNSVWSIHPVVLSGIDEREAALNELKAVLTEYEPLIGNFTAGTEPGQYDAELLEAFKNSIEAVKSLEDNPDVMDSKTAEDFKTMAQAIKDAYAALVASKVPIALADGYYRIKSGMEFFTNEPVEGSDEENPETQKVIHDKYMYSHQEGEAITGRWGTPEDLSTDGTALWKVTNVEGGNFDIVNMGTDARFNNVARSTTVTMSKTSENVLSIDPAANVDGVLYVNIRVSTQNGGDGLFLHTGGHSSGAGVSGNLVGWYNTMSAEQAGGSEWIFLPVSEEEAQAVMEAYAPIKDREVMLQRYDSLLAVAKEKLDLAIDIQRKELITDVSQITFDKTDPSEGSEAAIMDNDPTTFWHSDWHNKDSYGKPSLTIELAEPVQEFTWIVTRRSSDNDHVNLCDIYAGESSESLTKILKEQTIGNDRKGQVYQTNIDLGAPYKVVKFEFTDSYVDTRNLTDEDGNKLVYAHFAEFHMVQFVPNENAQIRFMGELGTNLQNVIAAQESLERDDITINEYNALKDALDAFLTKFTDPTALRQALADNKGVADVVVVGTQPGYWTNNFGAAAYQILYNEAEAYDAKGDYTPEQSADYVKRLTEGAENIYASAIGIQEGKWYRIKFGTEDFYDQRDWDKVAGNGSTDGKREALFGKYVTACNYFTDEEGYEIHEAIPADEIGVGQGLYFDDEMDINDRDMREFRFINVGDTAYMLQHHASNLFVKVAGTSGNVILSAHPTLFNVRAVGYGANFIAATNINGSAENYLHGATSGNTLVTWSANSEVDVHRCSLFIEEAGDVNANYDGSIFNILMADGSIGSWCFPIEVSVESNNAEMWGVSSLNGTEVTLCKLDKASAGRPFLLVCGDLEGYDPEVEEEEVVEMKQNFEIGAIEPDNSSALKGTYKAKQIGYGYIVQSGNQLVVSKTSSTTVGANGAYIEGEEKFDVEAEVTAVWDESAEDGLTEVINKVRNSGAVYTLDGRLVSKKATLSEVGRMPKGIYILNGVKIVIK